MITPLETIALAGLAAWLALALSHGRAFPREAFLAPRPARPDGPAPRVTAVVPARDEARMLPQTLPALLEQDLPLARVIVVDDGSSDGTAAVACHLAREVGEEERLTVVRSCATPDGWAGKVWAQRAGIAAAEPAESEWFLLTDADVRHRPAAVRALLAKAAEGYDLVSVMARLSSVSLWERLLVPPFVFFFHLLYPFRKVASPRSRVAAAAGGCILVSRAALERAGGVEAVRGAVIDDVSLAKAVAAAGGRLWLGFDPEIVSVRPYRGLGGLWKMVKRSAFVQLEHRVDLLLGTLVALALLVVAPPVVAAASLLGLPAAEGAAQASLVRALAAALLTWALEARAVLPYVRHHRVPVRYALAFPAAALLYGLMTLDSARAHWVGRGAEWKGRVYRAGT